MCGIVGIIDLVSEQEESILQRMRDALVHRGPDAAGLYLHRFNNKFLGFGHRRLSIIDTSKEGDQPMHLNHLSIVFNGEIYNYKDIRNELIGLGRNFKTQSDTEVVLHAFEEWGLQAVNRFNGMFAMALYDRENQELHLIRDRFGVKPLYYFIKNNCLLFASELKALHEHPSFSPQLDMPSLAHYFQYGSVPAPRAIFKNTFKVLPGTILTFNCNDLSSTSTCYWSPTMAFALPELSISFMEAKEHVRALLKTSVNYRTVADVPMGLFLSGGYDSATTAALLKSQGHDLKSFTVSVPDAGLNEGPKARKIAQFLNSDHTEIECSLNEALNVIPLLPKIYDEPFADSSAIPTYLISKEAVKSVKVALSADGGDELFAGYNRYLYYHRIPGWLKNLPPAAAGGIIKIMQWRGNQGIRAQRLEKFARLFKNFSLEGYMEAMTHCLSSEALNNLFYPNSFEVKESYKEARSPLGTLLLNDVLNYLPNDILHKVDRATMANGLEGREPLLDPELFQFLAQLPDSFKCNSRHSKILLKDIAHEYLPKELLEGPKKGFAIPINSWMRSHLKNQIISFSEGSFIRSQGIFNGDFIAQETTAFFDGNDQKGLFVWYFYSFQLWYQEWIQK